MSILLPTRTKNTVTYFKTFPYAVCCIGTLSGSAWGAGRDAQRGCVVSQI